MNNADYWRARFEQLELALLDLGENYYVDVERQYREAMRTIEHDITVWYKRLAVNNDISFAEAQKLLADNELEEFRWTLEEYIKKGKESHISPQWIRQLENASARAHITKLDAMKIQLQQTIESLCGGQTIDVAKTMQQIYSDGYYRTAFEVQKGIGVGSWLERLNTSRIEQVVSKPWAADGENFSDRIWSNKDKLVNQLHTELAQATIRGDGLDKIINTLSDKMNTSKSAAGRLVMTESAFFASASQRDCFSSLGVKQYEIIATLDSHTSETCRHLDGKVFKMSDFAVGVTAPPFHCRCRSCTAPYFADEKGLRAARGRNGKTYQVPADMKYEEWRKKYVDGDKNDIMIPTDTVDFKVKGFVSKQKANNHWGKHGADMYPGMSKSEYLESALDLVQSPTDDKILGHIDKSGVVTRYNVETNDFVKGHPNKGIYTMFKPDLGQEYYKKMKEADIKNEK